MSDLENLIRETLRAKAGEAPLAPSPAEGSSRGLTEGRRRQVLPAIALGVVLVGTGIALASAAESAHLRPQGLRLWSSPPSGEQAVSFHGIELLVPAAWSIDTGGCAGSTSGTVVLDYGSPTGTSCSRRASRSLTIVHLTTPDLPSGQQDTALAKQPVVVDGHSGLRGRGQLPGTAEVADVLVLPNPGVAMSVVSPSAALANHLLSTVQVVQVDFDGCAAHVAALSPAGPESKSGSRDKLVPGSPSLASLCRYSNNWVVRSIALNDKQRRELETLLNRLPVGASPAVLSGNCQSDRRRGFIAEFRYPNATASDAVYVHVGGCEPLTASNGSRTTGVNAQLINFLTSIAEYDGELPNPATLATVPAS